MCIEVSDHFELRGRGEAGDLRQIRAMTLADEAGGVKIIGAEIVTPFREAVGFIEDPGRDVAIPDGFDKTTASQLLG